MQISAQKTVGWIVLSAGLLIMFISIYYSYLFFTAKADFPQLFSPEPVPPTANLPAVEMKIPPNGNMSTANPEMPAPDMQKLTQQAVNQTVSSMVPQQTIIKMLNLGCWSVFAFFLVVAGSYVAGVGIKLLSVKQQ